ncbi:O-antigen polymerase [Flavobacterium urocaniciphilum]|uniref:Oligosaccharide repeat unit polymerase n=1 Tax=Flavobacterium urocaniciphilum TaxID=1299341 RepID=A0A1H8YRQ5_9FLAO|nr:O-antigen polymerase [Flavobacterium urocaniciphilum]SEP54773.1 oligosaccharide repeat unit polymerase [Flavobacterium urocaniciphilum]
MSYLIVLVFIILFGIYLARKNPKQHFLFLFALVLYFVYCFLGPLKTYQTGNYEKLGGNYYDYFDYGVQIYCIAIFSFIVSYFIGFSYFKKEKVTIQKFTLSKNAKYYLYGFFLIVTFVVYRFRQENQSDQIEGIFNYLLFFADSLILALAIFYYEKKQNFIIITLTIITFFYFLFLGFRYRVILLFIAFFYLLLIQNRIKFSTIIKSTVFIFLFAYIINFISVNRQVFKEQNFDEVVLSQDSPNDMSGYDYFLHQTDNYSTDFNVLKYMNKYKVDHDYGSSMFLHILIRITPASLYLHNKKPEIPQQEIIKNCFNSIGGQESGAAVTNIFAYYIAFGISGVVFFMSVLAFILSYFSKKLNLEFTRNRIIIVFIAMVLFQIITRGFFPQEFTLIVYLYITLKLFYKKNNNDRYTYKYSNAI